MTQSIVQTADMIWSAPGIFVLFSAFVYITLKAKLPQRRLGDGVRLLFHGKNAYRALAVNLSAVLGVGNISGVALAVCAGGPGAVFWCFISGAVGVGVQFSECLICAKYAQRKPNTTVGGPMYAMKRIGMRKTAVFYACTVCFCGLLIGAAIPSSEMIGIAAPSANGLWKLIYTLTLTCAALMVFCGGGRRVSDFCAFAAPPMVISYFIICICIIYTARASLPEAMKMIMSQAFALRPAAAGAAGYGFASALRWGVSRGLFSSEAGMGTAGMTAAKDIGPDEALERALGCACGTVTDTLILATVTGICFVAAAAETGCGFSDAGELIANAFSLVPYIGKYFIVISVTFLGFSSIIGWYWVACGAYDFLFKGKGRNILTFLWAAAVAAGPFLEKTMLWSECDILTALLFIPNLICVIRMLPNCKKELAELDKRKQRSKNTVISKRIINN